MAIDPPARERVVQRFHEGENPLRGCGHERLCERRLECVIFDRAFIHPHVAHLSQFLDLGHRRSPRFLVFARIREPDACRRYHRFAALSCVRAARPNATPRARTRQRNLPDGIRRADVRPGSRGGAPSRGRRSPVRATFARCGSRPSMPRGGRRGSLQCRIRVRHTRKPPPTQGREVRASGECRGSGSYRNRAISLSPRGSRAVPSPAPCFTHAPPRSYQTPVTGSSRSPSAP